MSAVAARTDSAGPAPATRPAFARLPAPPLALLTQGSPGGERHARLRESEREKRREEDQRELAAAGGSPAQVIQQAERDYKPESRAYRRDARDSQVADRQAFREALQQARSGETAAPPSRAGASENLSPANANPSRPAPSPALAETPGASPPSPPQPERPVATPVSPVLETSAPAKPAQIAASPPPATPAPLLAPPPAVRPLDIRSVASAPAAPAAGPAAASAASMPPGERGAAPPASAASAGARNSPARAVKAAAPEPADSADADANFERILRVIRSSVQHERGVATMRLDPPALGMLRLKIDLDGSTLRVTIDTENEVARRLLSADIDALRRELLLGGLRLGEVEVRMQSPVADAGTDARFSATDGGADSHGGSAQTSGEHDSPPDSQLLTRSGQESPERGAEPGSATESLVNVLA